MFSAVYASTAATLMSVDELEALLAQARAHNSAQQLTGMLLYKNARFIQALEGPEEAVRALLRSIASDPRHHSMRIVLEEQIDERRFPDWSMGFPHGGDAQLVPGYTDFLEQRQQLPSSTARVQLLLDWIRHS